MQSFYQHELEPETSPSALVVNGTPEVFFADKSDNGELSYWSYNSTEGWHITQLYRDAVAPGSSPYAFMGGTSYNSARTFKALEQPDVFFADANYGGAIGDWWNSTSGWQMQGFYGDPVAETSSPSALVWNGAPNVFFSDKSDSGELSDWAWSASGGWQIQNLFQDEVEPESSPSALMVSGTTNVFFADKHDSGAMSDWSYSATEGWQIQ